jgi:hypothetical protein
MAFKVWKKFHSKSESILVDALVVGPSGADRRRHVRAVIGEERSGSSEMTTGRQDVVYQHQPTMRRRARDQGQLVMEYVWIARATCSM